MCFFWVIPYGVVYFLSSLRGQTAKTLICTKSGVSADSRKSAEQCGEPHFLRKKCTKSAQKVRFSALFAHFSALFLESAETPLFVQINVFAVWPLRLDRKYTIMGRKQINKIPPNSRDSPVKIMLVCFYLYVFSHSPNHQALFKG